MQEDNFEQVMARPRTSRQAQSVPPQEPGDGISRNILRLAEELGSLKDRLEELEIRLEPVRRPRCEGDSNPEQVEGKVVSPIREQLQTLEDFVVELRRRVVNMTETLDLP